MRSQPTISVYTPEQHGVNPLLKNITLIQTANKPSVIEVLCKNNDVYSFDLTNVYSYYKRTEDFFKGHIYDTETKQWLCPLIEALALSGEYCDIRNIFDSLKQRQSFRNQFAELFRENGATEMAHFNKYLLHKMQEAAVNLLFRTDELRISPSWFVSKINSPILLMAYITEQKKVGNHYVNDKNAFRLLLKALLFSSVQAVCLATSILKKFFDNTYNSLLGFPKLSEIFKQTINIINWNKDLAQDQISVLKVFFSKGVSRKSMTQLRKEIASKPEGEIAQLFLNFISKLDNNEIKLDFQNFLIEQNIFSEKTFPEIRESLKKKKMQELSDKFFDLEKNSLSSKSKWHYKQFRLHKKNALKDMLAIKLSNNHHQFKAQLFKFSCQLFGNDVPATIRDELLNYFEAQFSENKFNFYQDLLAYMIRDVGNVNHDTFSQFKHLDHHEEYGEIIAVFHDKFMASIRDQFAALEKENPRRLSLMLLVARACYHNHTLASFYQSYLKENEAYLVSSYYPSKFPGIQEVGRGGRPGVMRHTNAVTIIKHILSNQWRKVRALQSSSITLAFKEKLAERYLLVLLEASYQLAYYLLIIFDELKGKQMKGKLVSELDRLKELLHQSIDSSFGLLLHLVRVCIFKPHEIDVHRLVSFQGQKDAIQFKQLIQACNNDLKYKNLFWCHVSFLNFEEAIYRNTNFSASQLIKRKLFIKKFDKIEKYLTYSEENIFSMASVVISLFELIVQAINSGDIKPSPARLVLLPNDILKYIDERIYKNKAAKTFPPEASEVYEADSRNSLDLFGKTVGFEEKDLYPVESPMNVEGKEIDSSILRCATPIFDFKEANQTKEALIENFHPPINNNNNNNSNEPPLLTPMTLFYPAAKREKGKRRPSDSEMLLKYGRILGEKEYDQMISGNAFEECDRYLKDNRPRKKVKLNNGSIKNIEKEKSEEKENQRRNFNI